MAQTALIQVRVDEDLKKAVDSLFSDLGFDTPTAIRMFLKQALTFNGLPFEIKRFTPNAETVAAMEEANRISRDPNTKKYSNFFELLDEVKVEILNEV